MKYASRQPCLTDLDSVDDMITLFLNASMAIQQKKKLKTTDNSNLANLNETPRLTVGIFQKFVNDHVIPMVRTAMQEAKEKMQALESTSHDDCESLSDGSNDGERDSRASRESIAGLLRYEDLCHEISYTTASNWLRKKGFAFAPANGTRYIRHNADMQQRQLICDRSCLRRFIYHDGHERADVQKARAKFIERITSVMKRCRRQEYNEVTGSWRNIDPDLTGGAKEVVFINQDETIIYENDDKGGTWLPEGKAQFRPKGNGKKLHVSGFISYPFGEWEDVDITEPHRDGNWTMEVSQTCLRVHANP